MTHRVCGFDPTKCFPIVGGKSVLRNDAEKAHETYSALFGTEQSLDRLGERGGFHPDEFALLVKGINPLHTGMRGSTSATSARGPEKSSTVKRAGSGSSVAGAWAVA